MPFTIFEPELVKKLAEILKENYSLKTLDLRGCGLSLDDIFMLNQALEKNEH